MPSLQGNQLQDNCIAMMVVVTQKKGFALCVLRHSKTSWAMKNRWLTLPHGFCITYAVRHIAQQLQFKATAGVHGKKSRPMSVPVLQAGMTGVNSKKHQLATSMPASSCARFCG